MVLEKDSKFIRVQIKSTGFQQDGVYKFSTSHGKHKRGYEKGSFDFLALYIHPLDMFFVMPFEALNSLKTINIDPYDSLKTFYKYKEAWDLLTV